MNHWANIWRHGSLLLQLQEVSLEASDLATGNTDSSAEVLDRFLLLPQLAHLAVNTHVGSRIASAMTTTMMMEHGPCTSRKEMLVSSVVAGQELLLPITEEGQFDSKNGKQKYSQNVTDSDEGVELQKVEENVDEVGVVVVGHGDSKRRSPQ